MKNGIGACTGLRHVCVRSSHMTSLPRDLPKVSSSAMEDSFVVAAAADDPPEHPRRTDRRSKRERRVTGLETVAPEEKQGRASYKSRKHRRQVTSHHRGRNKQASQRPNYTKDSRTTTFLAGPPTCQVPIFPTTMSSNSSNKREKQSLLGDRDQFSQVPKHRCVNASERPAFPSAPPRFLTTTCRLVASFFLAAVHDRTHPQ
jgi:hypothetical protein